MKIRDLHPDDAPALLPLVQALATDHGDVARATTETLARDLRSGWLWGFGAFAPDATLVGYVLLMPHLRAQFGERGADLHHVFVATPFRRQGLARRLIDAAEVDARTRGCTYLQIGANIGNDSARDTYTALGYAWSAPTFWKFRKTL